MSNIPLYTPVLKWKAGEKDAIKKLEAQQVIQISPILELVDSINTHVLITEIKDTGLKCAFIDSAYSEEENVELYKRLILDENYSDLNLVPVFYIDDLYNDITIVNQYNEVSVRLAIPKPMEANDPDGYKSFFEMLFNAQDTKIDLILDLNFVENAEAAALKNIALKETLFQLKDYHMSINKLIISSTSFPNSLNELEAGEEKKFKRYEQIIYNKIHNLPECTSFADKLIYSDYGVNKFTDSEIDFSKLQYGVLPKIKYTTNNFYYVQKSKKDRMRNIFTVSVFDMCEKIINSDFYFGKNFSFGDSKIYEKATVKIGPGGNKDWVTYSTVHHIAVILKQLSN